ncbi:hypothetical protein ACETRX_30585 [Labrys portucalensis]|uniref:Uncharacterized protein n=1 Tax=Labrys neptuniae TaxID=376174 RepID=A0ABV6ZPE8_9HYPH
MPVFGAVAVQGQAIKDALPAWLPEPGIDPRFRQLRSGSVEPLSLSEFPFYSQLSPPQERTAPPQILANFGVPFAGVSGRYAILDPVFARQCPPPVVETKEDSMTHDITLEHHIEELRAEYNACCELAEREAIWNALRQARSALAANEAKGYLSAFLAPADKAPAAALPF